MGTSRNPFGAGVAACLAAANLFRGTFLPDGATALDSDLRFSALSCDRAQAPTRDRRTAWRLENDAVLIGAGAVGTAAIWALARAPLSGSVHVVDPEAIELSNIQRYVLAERSDEGRVKVELVAAVPTLGMTLVPYVGELESFLSENGYVWDRFLLGLDSARDRRAAQASLPRWIANAWTQPGDLGVSVHPRYAGEGACVACLYLPAASGLMKTSWSRRH